MAAITASMVAELRAKTDAPMMECKKALTEANGNLDKAEELLRVKLGNKAGKAACARDRRRRGRRLASTAPPARWSRLNCETDFVIEERRASWPSPPRWPNWSPSSNPADVAALGALPWNIDGVARRWKPRAHAPDRQDRREHDASAASSATPAAASWYLPARHAHRRDGRVRGRRNRRQGRGHARGRHEAGRRCRRPTCRPT